MKITIDLEETGYPQEWDGNPETDPRFRGTIQEAIVAEAARQLLKEVRGDAVPGIRDQVKDVRRRAIEDALTPQIEEAINAPFRRTNTYGEPTGSEVTLRELILEEVKRYLEKPTGSHYRDRLSEAQRLVRDQVKEVVSGELKAAVQGAKDAAVQVVQETASEVVAERLKEKLNLSF